MPKTTAHIIEVVEDAELRRKEAKASEAVRRFFPHAGPLRLYRTAEGQIGAQLDVTLVPGDRQRLDEAYRAIMKVLGEKRGRPRGVKTIQTKLLLPEPAYRALKRAAAASSSTMSGLVAQLAVGLDEFEDYLELRDPNVRRHIRKSYQEYRAGKSRPAEQLLGALAKSKEVRPKARQRQRG